MTHMPFLQSNGFCGPASLKIILSHFGIDKSEKELAKMCGATRALGCEAKDIIHAASKFGLKTKIKDLSTLRDISQALKEKKAVMVEWFSTSDGHFSVVVKIDKENIYLQDPDLGHMRAMDLIGFRRVWFTFPTEHMRTKDDLILRRMISFWK